MDEKVFTEKLADVLGTDDELTPDTELLSIAEWDSTGAISFISYVGVRRPDIVLTHDMLKSAKTVRDLYALIGDENAVKD